MSSPGGTQGGAIATRVFTARDQENFAALSGDANPMHMDQQAARRTPAGACVVHGVQSFLWALETLAATLPLSRLRALDADFAQFLYLDEAASLYLVKSGETDARAELRVGETRISQYVLHFGEPQPAPADPEISDTGAIAYAASRLDPLPLDWDALAAAHGHVANFKPDAAAASFYPALSDAIGAARVSGIMALTRLVGMVSPGLHSTFHRIGVKFVAQTHPELQQAGGLTFSTARSDPRFSVATIAVRADGLTGTVKASRRTPPTMQPSSQSLRGKVPAGRFRGHTALVVGGSRGLGEVTAKLLGLTGVHVVVSYVSGEAEARSVARDIIANGGSAATIRLDVLAPLHEQLLALEPVPGSVYYFATQRISGRASPGFSPELFQRFCGVYVTAFHDLGIALAARAEKPLQLFYPSSVFVSNTTKGMAEYAMAKAAGEALASDLTRFNPKLEIDTVRLPRVATDQTAGMIEQEMGSAADCMAPIVLRIEARVAAGSS